MPALFTPFIIQNILECLPLPYKKIRTTKKSIRVVINFDAYIHIAKQVKYLRVFIIIVIVISKQWLIQGICSRSLVTIIPSSTDISMVEPSSQRLGTHRKIRDSLKRRLSSTNAGKSRSISYHRGNDKFKIMNRRKKFGNTYIQVESEKTEKRTTPQIGRKTLDK